MPDNFGFYQPVTLSVEVPDGPPEFKAGWHAGCKTGLANAGFANGWVYEDPKHGPDFGNGVYQHTQLFVAGWGQGWFSCVIHTSTFASGPMASMAVAPLTK